jgi:tetratricopeptide (TPR) repeat protein
MLERLIHEIHRRSMWQVFAIFLASGWAVLQVIDSLIDNGILPAWVFKAGLVLLLFGLPVVLATAFVQEGLPGSAPDAGADGERMAGDVVAENTPANLAAGTGLLDRVSTRAPTHHRLFTWRHAMLGGVAAFALLGVGAGGWMAMRVLGIGAVGTLAAQGVIERGAAVVLADFRSGEDAELGDVVTRTLRIDLMQSPMIRVLDRNELNAPLARMHAEPYARITSDIATQLAEREGYAAVITGDVAKAGSGYVLTAHIRAGEGFLPVAGFRETARSDDDLIGAIERLSRAIRDKAGESLRTVQGGPSLARVTTSSLPALREFTRGQAIFATGDWAGGLERYERAVALDSTFAMAHRGIAAALTNLRVRQDDMVRALRRTYELRDRLPDLERHLAVGSYYDRLEGDPAAAARAFEQALAIDSANAPAHNSLANIYTLLGRHDDAAGHFAAPLRTRPIASLFSNLAMARYRTGDIAGAMATVDSGMARLPSWIDGYFIKALLAAAQHDFRAADSLTNLLEQNARNASDRENGRTLRYKLAAVRGRLREAERVLDGPTELDLNDPVHRAAWRAELQLLKGDTAHAMRTVQQALAENAGSIENAAYVEAIIALGHARAGNEGTAALNAWRAATPDDHLGAWGWINRDVLAGTLQGVRGEFAESLATLESLRRRCPGCGSFVDYAVARTYDEMNQPAAAIAAYEQALAALDPATLIDDTHDIARALRRLGELYDAQGNTAKAVEYYARFTELWKDADPELQPIVRRVQDRLQLLVANRG